MAVSPVSEAIVHHARKRGILDRAGCARLRALLRHAGVDSVARARAVLSGNDHHLMPAIAERLVAAIAPPEQPALGPYAPLVHLADGGMGSVWLAAAANARLVVLKTLRGNHVGNQEMAHRFERETRFMQQLRHPNVVGCVDHGIAEDGTAFLVLEFEPSGDLRDLVLGEGWLPEALALAIVEQVARALAAAHTHRIIHRDIKPANIFCSTDGVAKLADFGIARSTTAERTMLTMQGMVVGSPGYMSPEQVIAIPDLDIRSDIYALGAVLYFCLCGMEPYQGGLNQILHAHRTAPVPDVRQIRPGVDPATAAIITRCMQKRREDRYGDPEALAEALVQALAGLHVRNEDGDLGEAQSGRTMALEQGRRPRPSTSRFAADQPTIATDHGQPADDGEQARSPTAATIAIASIEWAGVQPGNGMGGDFATAFATGWLSLSGPDGRIILLWARDQLTLGKLCEPPVDICLRKHPVARFRDDCLRISRQHVRLRYDQGLGRIAITDLGSGNGTSFDGTPIEPHGSRIAELDQSHYINVAKALDLRLRVVSRREEAVAAPRVAGTDPALYGVGLSRHFAVDAAVLTRPDNRPGLSYAMVLRRISIGPDGDLQTPGAGPGIELGVHCGRWLQKLQGVWQPLPDGARVDIAGSSYLVGPGGYQQFVQEAP